jgi:hypothetical protein
VEKFAVKIRDKAHIYIHNTLQNTAWFLKEEIERLIKEKGDGIGLKIMSAPVKTGEGDHASGASMVEGAFDSTLNRRRRMIVACDAPSTALRAVPLPRYRGAGGRRVTV